jgi:transcriptional regulator with XRE-family HTH domain
LEINWQKEIADLCEKRNWSLRTLATDIGVSVNYLSEVMNEKRPPSLPLKIKLAGRIGWNKSSELLIELLPDDAANAWSEWDKKTTDELGKKLEHKAETKERKISSRKK